MRTVATWVVATLIGLVAVVGLIAFLNSRDRSEVAQQGPGTPYKGQPPLSSPLRAAVELGNVVVLYRDVRPPTGTLALVPPAGDVLLKAGQSVVVRRDPSLDSPLAAVSAQSVEKADTAGQLSDFVDYWIGRR